MQIASAVHNNMKLNNLNWVEETRFESIKWAKIALGDYHEPFEAIE